MAGNAPTSYGRPGRYYDEARWHGETKQNAMARRRYLARRRRNEARYGYMGAWQLPAATERALAAPWRAARKAHLAGKLTAAGWAFFDYAQQSQARRLLWGQLMMSHYRLIMHQARHLAETDPPPLPGTARAIKDRRADEWGAAPGWHFVPPPQPDDPPISLKFLLTGKHV